MKKWLNLRNIVTFALTVLVTIAYNISKPKIEKYLKDLVINELKNSDQLTSFELVDLEINLIPPSIDLVGVELMPKNFKEVQLLKFENARIYPDLFKLLSLDIKISTLAVVGLNLVLKEPPNKPKKTIKFSYEDLSKLPIKNFKIEQSNIVYNKIESKIGFFELRKRWNRFEIYSDFNAITINEHVPVLNVNKLSMTVEPEVITLKQLSVISEDSNLQLGFEINKEINEEILDLDTLRFDELRLNSKINLNKFKYFFEKALKTKLDEISGTVQVLAYKSIFNKKNTVEVTAEAKDVRLDNYYFDNLVANGSIGKNYFKVKFVNLVGKAFNLTSKDLIIKKIKDTFYLKSEGKFDKIEVGKVLEYNFGIKGAPFKLPGSFNYKCGGRVSGQLDLACEISGDINQIHIWSDSLEKDKSTIIKLKPSQLRGQAMIFSDHMTFESAHTFKNSQVNFTGKVDYIKGFDIEYASDFFNFTDVESMVNIPIEGFGSAYGKARGSSKWGTFDIKTDLANFSFFKYRFDQVKGDLKYLRQKIYFSKVHATAGGSLINANIEFNTKESIISTIAESKKISLKDLQFIIKDIAKSPIYMSGEGDMNIIATGPLNLGEMTYDIEAHFKEGIIYKDRYKDLNIKVNAVSGEVKTENTINYLGDKINVDGSADPNGTIDIIALSDSINLSRIDALKSLGLVLNGTGQMQVHLTDYILLPYVDGKFVSTNLKNNYNQLGKSEFDFKVHKDFTEVNGSFFDSSLTGLAYLPHNDEGQFLIDMNFEDIDPFKYIQLFDSKISKVGSNTEISGKLNLSAKTFQLELMNGELEIRKLKLSAEKTQLAIAEPSLFRIENGVISGNSTFTDHLENNLYLFLSEKSNFLRGNINLGFLRTLLPEVEEIKGQLNVDARFQILPKFKFLSGSGTISDMSLKVEDLVHSFRDMSTDLRFYGQDLLISNLRGFFANGFINGKGKVYFTDSIGVDLQGEADRLNLKIPEGFKSVISGEYFLKGDGFPYTLGGDFSVLEGLFEMEFASQESAQYTVTQSPFLPNSRQNVSALLLDAKVKTKKPLVIDNSYIDGRASADLSLKGSPSFPVLKGQITRYG